MFRNSRRFPRWDYLLDYQRGQAKVARDKGFAGLVMEGRDIGSVIFPEADVRLFLTAVSGDKGTTACGGGADRRGGRARPD